MLRPLLSELTIQVEIEGTSNLLVKDGRYHQDQKQEWCTPEQRKAAPDFMFVSRNDLERLKQAARDPKGHMSTLDYYLPGASVRGAWRSHLEKVLRSLDDTKICDPMATKDADMARPDRACSARLVLHDQPLVDHPYRDSCPVCKLFGSTAQASRLAISDGVKTAGNAVMVDNVAISRQTGSVISPFKSIVLHGARFSLEMRLRNFELWQVGLLGHLFDDLEAKRVPLGSGKNKGFGVVQAHAASMKVAYYGRPLTESKLYGLRELLADPKRAAAYGLLEEESVDVSGIASDGEGGSRWRKGFQIATAAQFWQLVKPRFNRAAWESLPGPRPLAAGA